MAIRFTEKASTDTATPKPVKPIPQVAAPKDIAKKPVRKASRKGAKSDTAAVSPLLPLDAVQDGPKPESPAKA